jgi:hypothetical protein
MEVFAEGYRPREVQFAIVEQNPTLLNVTLSKDVSRRKDIDAAATPVKLNTKTKDGAKKGSATPKSTEVFDEDLEDDEEVDKKDESGEKDEKEATGLFGLPNPFAKIQTNVKSLLNKIPIIG